MQTQLKELKVVPTGNTFESVKIMSSKNAETVIRQFYFEDIDIYESCFILLLNRANRTVGYAKISQGGVACTVVDTKIIMKYAVDTLASAIILAHNHPSGELRPSAEDKHLTNRVAEAAKILEVTLMDHIIITSDGYTSMADEALINV